MAGALELLRDLMHSEAQRELIVRGGYALLGGIVFAETGLLVGFFLPGDSLLFSAGVVAALGQGLDVVWLNALLMACAILGDAVGYAFGRWSGPRLFDRPRSFFFRRDHLLATRAFYDRHGGKTIVLARFMPFARTFAPIVAGIAGMGYRRFALYNVAGAMGWVASMTLLGYFLGRRLTAGQTEKAILLIIAASLLPLAIGWLRRRRGAAGARVA